jgi:beta-1,4-N-acetylglucosaminyltransferase
MGKTALVTVGTTLFESLIETVTDAFVLGQLRNHGFTNLVIQYGKGTRPKTDHLHNPGTLHIECYDFKPSLQPDLHSADLILSHAGAGTLLEATKLLNDDVGAHVNNNNVSSANVIIVAVINRILMDNHQTELAYALQDTGCLCVVDTATDLLQAESWDRIMTFQPEPFPKGDEDDVPRILNGFFGFGKMD